LSSRNGSCLALSFRQGKAEETHDRAWPTRPIRLIAQHQPPAEFARQVAEDKIFFAALLKELDIKLE
jgi:hypothetical protein